MTVCCSSSLPAAHTQLQQIFCQCTCYSTMLRNTPQPVGEVCLSFDVGSQNAGLCLLDAMTQQILYLNTHKLLAEQKKFVTSTQDVQHHLHEITTP